MPPGTVVDQRIYLTRLIRKDRHGFLYEAAEPAQHEPTALRALTELGSEPEPIFAALKELVAKRGVCQEKISAATLKPGREPAIGGYWLRAEWAQGQLLDRWLHDRSGLPLAEAISLLAQIAAALTEANEHALFHSDLRPSNILLSASPRIRSRESRRNLSIWVWRLCIHAINGRAASLQGAPLWLAP